LLGHCPDVIDVLGGMEILDLIAPSEPRRAALHGVDLRRLIELGDERIVSIGPERMTVWKTIRGNLLAADQQHSLGHRRSPPESAGSHSIAQRAEPVAWPRAFIDNRASSSTVEAMAQYIYTTNRLSKVVPPKRYILRDISLSFFPGAKIGVLGLNGAGKSTLLRIMAGVDSNFDGEARPQPGIKLGFLPQEPELDETKDVRGNVEDGVRDIAELIAKFNAISDRFAEPLDDEEMNDLLAEQGKLQDAIDAAGGWELERKLEIAADALRLPPWDADVAKLSGGERRRVALCRLLLSEPDMLLLDEPTNHLDAESVAWLERFLAEYPGTVMAVTHDRYFLDNVAGWILELDRGYGIPWEGNYSSWLDQKDQRLELEEKREAARQRAIKTELEWVRSNPKARQAKAKARLQRFDELSSKDFQSRNETNEIYIPPGPRLGDLVVEADGIGKSFGDRLLFENLSFSLPPGGIVGVIGPNGAGKTTLFRMIVGSEQPDSGTLRLGESVDLAYVDQSRDALDADKTVWEEVSDGQDILTVGSYETSSRAYLGRFNFRGTEQQKKVGLLSGGERNRVHLAKLLRSGGNLLLLDEPTNDLDVETLRALEEALLNFPGSAVVISHDRWFLDRIATHILAFEGNSEVVYFEGNYAEYIEDLKRRKGQDADQPHRIRYKRLSA
jgi:sulfate-transporting ATPase